MLESTLNRPCGGRYGSLIEAVGNTPLVALPGLSPTDGVTIYAKLEGRNPTGSVKDRVAKSMMEAAEAEGAIEPGHTILEPTSGNTGISLAMICRLRGYPLKVVMPDNVTEERTELLRMYGAEIVYSEGDKGSNGAVELALEMAESDSSYFMPYQYGNEANPRAHYDGTAVEILEDLDCVAAFVAGLGTGGTLMGAGRRLKEADPRTKIVAAEPMQGELVQGLRSLDDGFIPPIIDLSLLDRKVMVSNRDAILWTQRLLREEGLFAGVWPGRSPPSRCASPASSTPGTSSSWFPTTGGSTSRRACTPSPSTSSRSSTPRSGGEELRARRVSASPLQVAAARVRELAADYEPPDFVHVPDPDAALFLCAVDHRTGYRRAHRVGGRGPFEGSELMWEVALDAGRSAPGLLRADRLLEVSAADVAQLFEVGAETVADPERRAELWRDLARRLSRGYGASASRLLASAGAELGGHRGLIARLAEFEAYADPLGKKAFLYAKICERRGWLEVADPESWEVCADNVLMRLALRAGLVEPGRLYEVRLATRCIFKRLAAEAGLAPPVLDDLLWERGRDDADLLGTAAGERREPPRDPDSAWY